MGNFSRCLLDRCLGCSLLGGGFGSRIALGILVAESVERMLQGHEILARLEGVEHGFLFLELFLRVVGRLDGEANPAIRAVDLDHAGADFLAHLEGILDLVDAILADLADMHQAVDVVLESDERTKACELGDLAGDEVADLVVVVDGFPRILGQLLDAGGDALVFAIDLEHLCLDFHALLEHFGRVVDLARPRNVGHVDHCIETFLQPHEGTITGKVANLAGDL